MTRDAGELQEHIVDFEREPETALGDSQTESEQPITAGGDAAEDEATSLATSETVDATNDAVNHDENAASENAHEDSAAPAETAPSAQALTPDELVPSDETFATSSAPVTDFDSDADVLDDAFASAPRPPEWPAADFVNDDAAQGDAQQEAIAAAYATAAVPADLGDDSDAPVLTDAASTEEVNLTQGGLQSIQAKTVTLSQSGAGQVHAEEMNVSQSGVGIARVGNLTLGDGASAFAVVADEATVEQGSNAFLVIARSFNGETKPSVDWRTAMAFGAGLGLALSIFRRIR